MPLDIVDGHFEYFLFCFKFVWTERVLAIINSAEIGIISYVPLLQGSNLMFLTWNIGFSMLKMKIFDPTILIKDPEHILIVPWSIRIHFPPCHLWKQNSFFR